jgi:hypothetical protein
MQLDKKLRHFQSHRHDLAIGVGLTGVLLAGLVVALAAGALETVTTRQRGNWRLLRL